MEIGAILAWFQRNKLIPNQFQKMEKSLKQALLKQIKYEYMYNKYSKPVLEINTF